MTLKYTGFAAACMAAMLVCCSCGQYSSKNVSSTPAALVADTAVSPQTMTATTTVPATEPETEQFTLDVSVPENKELPEKYTIDGVTAVMQEPELPTGCEVTALTTALNYLGFNVKKVELADNFMPITLIGETLMDEAYVGSPHTDGFGCNANIIVQTADKYFASIDSPSYAADLTGSEFDDLLYQVSQGRPVITWVTIDLKQCTPEYVWDASDGRKFYFNWYQHCMVIYGYDLKSKKIMAADPLKGNVEYDLETFKSRYEQMEKQAVVICGDSETKGHHVTSDAERAVKMPTLAEIEEASQTEATETSQTQSTAEPQPETASSEATTASSAPQTEKPAEAK